MRVLLHLLHKYLELQNLGGLFSLMRTECSSLFLLISFGLKSILSDIKIATLHWFLGSFTLNTFPHILPKGDI